MCHVLYNITYTAHTDNILYPDVCDNPDVGIYHLSVLI